VPLFFYVPGKRGGLIDATVGTIDIVPTLVDLMGKSPRASHAGRSLVPAMLGEKLPDAPYFFMSGNESQVGVVVGQQKHIFDRSAGVHLHFDVERDPLENHNIVDATLHEPFVRLLVQQYPEVFRGDLDDARVQALLDRRLAELPVAEPPAALPFLLRTIRASPTKSRLTWARRVFEHAPSDAVRLSVLAELGSEHMERFGPALRKHLQSLDAPEREAPFVDAVADLGLPAFEQKFVSKRFERALSGPQSQWLPWLRLTAWWRTKAKHVRPLARLSEKLLAENSQADLVTVRLLLRALAGADLRRDEATASSLESWAAHANPTVRADAVRALGSTGSPRARELIERALSDDALQVRLAALEGLRTLLGKRVIPQLERAAKVKENEATVLRLATTLESKRAKKLIRKLAKHAKNGFVRRRAKDALSPKKDALAEQVEL